MFHLLIPSHCWLLQQSPNWSLCSSLASPINASRWGQYDCPNQWVVHAVLLFHIHSLHQTENRQKHKVLHHMAHVHFPIPHWSLSHICILHFSHSNHPAMALQVLFSLPRASTPFLFPRLRSNLTSSQEPSLILPVEASLVAISEWVSLPKLHMCSGYKVAFDLYRLCA